MIGRGSRYRPDEVYPSNDPGRKPDRDITAPQEPDAVVDYRIVGVRPHRTEPLEVRREHRVAGHERLDTLAQRYYGDPLLFWLICDANETIFPDDLMISGRLLRIPRNKL